MKNNIIIVIASFLLFAACKSNHESSDTLEKIKTEEKIKVGYIPYFDVTFKDPNSGKIKGFLVDVLYKTMEDINISSADIEFVETDWQNFGLGLSSGKYDLCIAGTFKTPVREKTVRFSDAIFYLGNGALVMKNDDRFKSIQDFNRDDITIAVVQGEQGYEYAKEHLNKPKIHALAGSDLSIAPLEVKLGRADAALSDQYILKRFADKNPEVKDALANNPYDVLPICWSVSKSNEDTSLINYINKQISELVETGEIDNIKSKYSMIPFAEG